MNKDQHTDQNATNEHWLNGRKVVLTDDEGYVFARTGEALDFDQVQRMGLDATLRDS